MLPATGAFVCDKKDPTAWSANDPNENDVVQLIEHSEQYPVHTLTIFNGSLKKSTLCLLTNLGTQLQSLRVNFTRVTNNFTWTYTVLKNCPNLKSLDLTSVFLGGFQNAFWGGKYGREITHLSLREYGENYGNYYMSDADFNTLMAVVPKLEYLNLSGFPCLSSAGLSKIATLKNIQILGLNQLPGIDDDVVYNLLTRCQSITRLFLTSSAKITKNSISHICGAKIKELNFGGCHKIPAENFRSLSRHPTLEYLSISDTKADDSFMKEYPPHLKILDIRGTKISQNAIEQYKAEHPNIQIIVDVAKIPPKH